jgi:hypothetical protein
VLADAVDATELVGHDPFLLIRGVRSILWYVVFALIVFVHMSSLAYLLCIIKHWLVYFLE